MKMCLFENVEGGFCLLHLLSLFRSFLARRNTDNDDDYGAHNHKLK